MFSALRERNYRRFWTAQFISNIGTWMQTVAQGWLVLRLTDSAFMLGLVGFANSVPTLFLMLPGGVLADRVDRRRLLRIAQTGQAACAFFLSVSIYLGTINVWQIIGIAVLMGITTAFSSPTYQAFVLDLLSDRSKLPNAIAMNSLQFNLSRALGPSIAGILLTYAGVFWCFFANALSFVPLIAVLSTLPPSAGVRAGTGSVVDQLLEGFRFVRARRRVSTILFVVAASSFFGYPYITMMPLVADRLFGPSASGLGFLMACLGGGALSGSLLIAATANIAAKHRFRVIQSANVVFGLAIAGVALSTIVGVTSIALFLGGLAMVVGIASCNTALQEMIPDSMRGRVLSMYTFSFFGVVPFGNLLSGALAERWGVLPTFLGMSGGLLLSAFTAGVLLLRSAGEERSPAPDDDRSRNS